MQPVGQILEQVPADIMGWLAVFAGLAIFALLLRLQQVRQGALQSQGIVSKKPVYTARQLESGRDWRLVTDGTLRELVRAAELVDLQALATNKVDAAEHAFNRLIAECAMVDCRLSSPTQEPVRQIPPEPAMLPQRQPLAA